MADRPDHMQAAGRALQTLSPSTDLLAEAERRVARVAEVAPIERGHPHRWQWLAAAAVVAALVGTLLVLTRASDPNGLDTGPAGTGSTTTAPTTTTTSPGPDVPAVAGELTSYGRGCPFAVVGSLGPTAWVEVPNYFPSGITGRIGDGQSFELSSPADSSPRPGAERSQVRLESGPATVLATDEAALVRTTGTLGSAVCNGSFSVEVTGGSREDNLDQATSLAKRVVPGGRSLAVVNLERTDWTVAGAQRIPDPLVPVPAGQAPPEQPLPIDGLTLDFDDGTVSWSDGCDELTAETRWGDGPLVLNGHVVGMYTLTLEGTASSGRPCAPGTTSNDVIRTLMAADPIVVSTGTYGTDGTITLMANGVSLELVAAG